MAGCIPAAEQTAVFKPGMQPSAATVGILAEMVATVNILVELAASVNIMVELGTLAD